MKLHHVGLVVLVVGVVALTLSFAWPTVHKPTQAWTDDDYQEYQETLRRVRANAGIESRQRRGSLHGQPPPDPEKVLQNREDTKKLQEMDKQVEAARSRPASIATMLKWGGAALIVVGASLTLASRGSQST